jgi:isoleucyl-tRNA synthetase
MAEQANTPNQVSYKDTLNLPRTDFPIRADAKVDDPQMIARWAQENLYKKSFECHKGQEKFILHDGPPYANGNIHVGHAYNKILKDIVGKSQRMMGKNVPITPGWDCHGLPIELKVTQENPGVTGSALKKACRAYAQKWIDIQREEFKRLGVLMDWENPYITMNYEYEASILRAFAKFVEGGYIERKNKTVPWCAECQTVLAQAEIEYQDQKDPSVYVLFPLPQSTTQKLFANVGDRTVNLLIWTTTPWTLPLNRAVMIKPGAEYVVLDINNTLIVVAKALADKIVQMMSAEKKVVAEFVAEQLVAAGKMVQHPFIDLHVPLILSDTVSLDDGTAFVHCAPGCGPEDYEVGVRNNLEIYSPISPDGKYTKEITPHELEGMPVKDGQIWVIKKLAELGKMFHKTSIKHAYPYCWRSHTPLIFRATKQWFCDLSKDGLKENAIKEADTVHALPDKSINRLKATLEGRLEWVLSRQRTWGVPIPALICTGCDHTYSTPELIHFVAQNVEKHGIEYWDDATVKELLPKDYACSTCRGTSFKKENDILDVWFDSGVSHYAVLEQNPALAFPANMYLEGKDQHRGWFQSSLLTSVVLEDKAPMKEIVTHGFTVDAQGRKMSKSLGNVVNPQQMIDDLGTDGLRLWASSIDISGEAVVSKIMLDNIKEVFRKVRNTSRFLLSNLYDFDIQKDAMPLDQLLLIDQYALQELFELNVRVINAYAEYDFTAVAHMMGDYCSVQLSSFYLDIIKDRLYVEKADGPLRRSAQTASWYILDTLTRLMAPIMSFTAEQVSDHYQKNKKESIHLQEFAQLQDVWKLLAQHHVAGSVNYEATASDRYEIRPLLHLKEMEYSNLYQDRWQMLRDIRSAVLKAIEGLRAQGIIKHSLEAQVILHLASDAPTAALFKSLIADLRKTKQGDKGFFEEFFIVSDVVLKDDAQGLEQSEMSGLSVKIEKAPGQKCARCWQWKTSVNERQLDERCQKIVG